MAPQKMQKINGKRVHLAQSCPLMTGLNRAVGEGQGGLQTAELGRVASASAFASGAAEVLEA